MYYSGAVHAEGILPLNASIATEFSCNTTAYNHLFILIVYYLRYLDGFKRADFASQLIFFVGLAHELRQWKKVFGTVRKTFAYFRIRYQTGGE